MTAWLRFPFGGTDRVSHIEDGLEAVANGGSLPFRSVKDSPYNAKGDGKQLLDAQMTLGSAVLISGNVFTNADVGKNILVAGAGPQFQMFTFTATGGSFTLTDPVWGTTGTINYSSNQTTMISNISTALNALAGAGGNSFQVASASQPGIYWVRSQNAALTADHTLTIGTNSLTGGTLTIAQFANDFVSTIASVAAGVATLAAAANSTAPRGAGATATTLTAAVSAGQNWLPVTSTTGFAAGQCVTVGSNVAVIVGIPSATRIDLVDPLTASASNGAAVTQTGSVAIFATDDTAAINAAITATNAAGGGTVVAPPGIYGITGACVIMLSNVRLLGAGRDNTWFALVAQTAISQPGVVSAAGTARRFEVCDLRISGRHWRGGPYDTPAEAAFYPQGCSEWAIRRCYLHNANSNILQIISTLVVGTATCDDIVIDDIEIWGGGEDGFAISPTQGNINERIRVSNLKTHDNFLHGIEVDCDTGNPSIKHLTFHGITAYKNLENGMQFDAGSGRMTRVTLTNIDCYENGNEGLGIGLVDYVTLAGITCLENAWAGLHLSSATNVTGSGITLNGNGQRALQIDSACSKVDLAFNADSNGASASAGTAAVEVLATGGASSDITLRGQVTNSTKNGVKIASLTRGWLDLTVSGTQTSNIGVVLNTCNRVNGLVRTSNNAPRGLQFDSTCVNCSFVGWFTTDNASQTEGWKVNDAASTGIRVLEMQNDCTTPFTDNSTATPGTTRMAFQPSAVRRTIADAVTTIRATDSLVVWTSLSAARVITLPTASTFSGPAGIIYTIKDESGSASATNKLTLTPTTGNIDGAASKDVVVAAYGQARFYHNGTNWFTV